MTKKNDISFEKAFERLESILEKMNQTDIGLDESIKLYEEADGLIKTCTVKLGEAESKVEKLMKDRNGNILTNKDE